MWVCIKVIKKNSFNQHSPEGIITPLNKTQDTQGKKIRKVTLDIGFLSKHQESKRTPIKADGLSEQGNKLPLWLIKP